MTEEQEAAKQRVLELIDILIDGLTKQMIDDLVTDLMQQTFHHSDETAKPIVDAFVKRYPVILEHHDIEFLYKI